MLPKTLEKTTVGILLDLSPVCGAPHIYFTVGRIGQIDNDVDNNGILHCWPWSSLGLIRERSGAEVEQGSLESRNLLLCRRDTDIREGLRERKL